MAKKLSIYPGEPLARALAATGDDAEDGNRSGRVNTVAARYLMVVAAELRRLDLSRAEWCAIVDALNGSWLDETSIPFIGAEIADAVGLGEKWGVDQQALSARLMGLSTAAQVTVVEVAERFWAHSALPTDAALAAAGVALPARTP
jgi:hypothetical protein